MTNVFPLKEAKQGCNKGANGELQKAQTQLSLNILLAKIVNILNEEWYLQTDKKINHSADRSIF